jgi:hypothetical protein
MDCVEEQAKLMGLPFRGQDAETMMVEVRAFFQPHCPRGSYVSRRYIAPKGDHNFEQHTWRTPRPLFEDDNLGVDEGID